MDEFAEAVVRRFGVVHQIYNNAGIALNTKVLDSTWNDYERLLSIDLNGVIHDLWSQAAIDQLYCGGSEADALNLLANELADWAVEREAARIIDALEMEP